MASRKIYISLNGVSKTMLEWAQFYDIPYNSMYARYSREIVDANFIIFGKKGKPEDSGDGSRVYKTLDDFKWEWPLV